MRKKKEKRKKKKEKVHHKNRPIICTSSISRRISLIIFIIFAGFIIAMMTYQGTFLFWRYPFSDLGTLYTVNHQQFNITSLLFFDLAMLASGLLMLQIAHRFTFDIPFQHKRTKQILSFTCGIGFLLLIFPYPVHFALHVTGATLAVGSLWGLAILFSVEIKDYISTTAFFFCQLLLHGSIISYAILYVMRLSSNDIVQKIGIVSLMIVFWITTRYRPDNDASLKNYQESSNSN